MKKLILIGSISVFLTACGSAAVNSNTNSNAVSGGAQSNTNANANTSANKANTNAAANKPANTTAAKPAETGPKRIAFSKGKSEGTENVTLAVGESKKFVVGAKTGQILMIEAASKDTKISVTKGKVATNATKEEPGYYDTTLLGDGDFVFEVKNTSKTELKTSVNVLISGGN